MLHPTCLDEQAPTTTTGSIACLGVPEPAEMDAAFGYGLPEDVPTEADIDALYAFDMERDDCAADA